MVMNSSPLISVNGVLTTTVSALDRGFAFGDGVFETLRVINGRIPLWPYHRARLLQGCKQLLIPLDIELVESWRDQLLASAPSTSTFVSGVLKIVVTRGAGGRGYQIDPSLIPTIACSLFDYTNVAGTELHLHVCQQNLSSGSLLAGLKHLNRLENIMLKAECQRAGFEDGVAMTADGLVIETTSCNLFFERAGQLMTPSLAQAGVAGVMRQLIIDELAPSLNISVQCCDISAVKLSQYSSVFACNSVQGISPVTAIGDCTFTPSPLLRLLQRGLSNYLREKSS